jgi:hypothetical protein
MFASAFIAELTKRASFRQRFSTALVSEQPSARGFPATRTYAMTGPTGEVGHMSLHRPPGADSWQVKSTYLVPEFRGFRLGRKLYGDVMRAAGPVSSDRLVSDAATRVWRGMAASPSYRVSEAPSLPTRFFDPVHLVSGREAVGSPSVFTGRLTRGGPTTPAGG